MTDGATGAPLAGATVSLSGASTDSTVAGADGGYQFSSLPAGTFTITVAAPGYDSATATATLAANTVALFSPSLYPTGTTPTTATLRGEVVDAATGQPIAGATITAAAQTATTDATGHFTLAGLTAGALSATVGAQGYTGATLTGTLANGVNEAGTLRLAPLPAAVTTVSGTVRDATSGQPIPGASVHLQEVADAVFTGADGHYQLTGITAEAFTVTASAAGYLSRTAGVSAQLGSTVAADFDLDRSQSAGGIRIETVTTDQPAYDPYGKVEISAEVSNASDQTADLIFSATIRDASLNLVAEVPAIQLVLGQSPGDAVQPVPAHGNATIEIAWPNTAAPAGTYSVVVRAVTMGGAVIAEGGTGFDINALQRIGGGITLNPPITQADSQQPIALGANLLNAGNLPIPAGPAELTVTLANPDNVPPPPPVAGVSTLHSGVPLAAPRGGVFDEAGNYYVVNGSDRRVIKIDPAGQAEILATLPSTLAVNSIIPVDLTRDSAGALWILNSAQLVLKLTPDGTLSSRTTGLTSQTGFDLDPDGNFYITGNQGTDRVLARLDPTGQLTILVANGLSGPTGLVSAGDGTWFVSNYNDNTVARIDADGHVTPFATGLNRPQGLTRDGQGNLYVANSGANSVVRIAPDGTPSIHAAGLNGPADLRFNSAGELFVSNAGDNTVAKVLPDGTVRTFARGIAVNPEGMQYDPAGDLYIANGNGSVTRLDAAGGYSVVATGLGSPKDLEIGPGGEIYVANYAGGRVMKISGSGVSTLASGLQSPYGLAFDGNGLLHVAESSANRLSTLDGSGQRTTVLDSLLNSPQDALEAPDGQIRVLSSKFIATLGSHGQGGLVTSGFSGALGFTLASDGGFYVVDGSTTVKRVDPAGTITTFKTGLPYNPYGGITADDAGNLYLADYSNRQIVKLDAAGTVSSFAVLGTYPIRLIRDAQGGYYSLSVNGEIHAIGSGGSVALVTTLSGARNLALAADGRLFVATSSSVVVLSTAGVKTTLLSGLSDVSDALPLANGQWITVERTLGQLKIYDAQNALAEQINGFSAPRDLLWTGSEFLFADGAGAILSWTPGHHPRRVGSGRTANYLAWRGGDLYLSDSSAISTLAANGSLPSYYSLSGLSNLSGLAVRPDGALTLAGNSDSRVLTLDPARQIVASYAGFSSPGALAVDGADHVFVASGGTQEIVKIDPAGRRSDVFAVNAPTSGLAFDGSGQLYGVNATTVYRFSATGTRTTVASDSGAGLSRLAIEGGTLLATSLNNGIAYRVQGSGLVPFAAGLSGTVGVRRGPAGALYVASQNNGSVARYADGALSVQAAGLPSPRRLAFGPSGTLYVAGNSGNVMAIAAGGARTDLKLEPTLGTDAFDGIAVDPQGTVRLTRPNRNDVVAFAEPIPPEIPAPGTVVYTLPLDLAALPVSGNSLALALGNWTPDFSGDYEVRLRSGQAGVEGALVNTLHMCPHANAQMSIDRTTVAPTRDGVGVSLTVEGADFTSLAKADTANLVRSVSSGAYPSAMGADAAGNIYFASGGAVRKVDPAGTVTTFAVKSTAIRGQIPVDSAQNLYISDGTSNRLLRLAPDGTASLLATLPGNIVSLVVDTQDNLFVLTVNQIVKVRPDGSQSLVTTAGITSPFSLTIDGKGNLYVQNYGNIINRVAPDGRVSTLPTTGASFEYEGNNIAGDCADNLFLTPFSWPQVGQSGEEHTLVQLIGRSGQAAAILDGRTVNPDLGDMDFIIYDRFGGNLLIWTDYNGGRIYHLPVTCGAIGTELHVVLPQGQTAEGLTPAPTAVLARPDGSAEYLWNLKDVTALGRTVRFDTALENLALGEERWVAEDAYLVFQNSFVPGEVRVPIAIPKVRVENLVDLRVATDRPSYPENTEVLIDVELINANGHPVEGLAVVEIEDALGVRVANVLAEPAAITAEDRSTLAPVFNTGHYQAGEYTVRAYLRDAEGADLAGGSSRFRIVAGDGSGALLDAAVSTGQAVYPPYATVVISSQVRNLTGNLLLNGLTVNETVTDPSGQAVFTASRTMPQLVGGHLEESSFSFPLVAAATGDYTVTQIVTAADGTLLDTRTAGFMVESTADTGFGLSGRLTVAPTPVPLGTPFTLSYTAENLGNADLSGVSLILRLVDPAAGSLIQEWRETADLLRQTPYSGSRTDAGSDLVAGQTYAAVLSAVVGGSERVLARTTVPVTAPPPRIRLDISRHTVTGRVLVLLSCQGDEDDTAPAANPDGTHPPAPCLESRFALVDRVLTELDVRHRIVTTVDDFRRAFRSGIYDTLWLSGGRVKLDHDLSREVRAAVFRGEGLLIDGQHDERNRLLDEAGGFLYRGQLGTPDLPVEFSQPPFISQTLQSKGRGLRLELAGGSTVAGFPEGTPAGIRNLYGLGHSLAFGFDLPESLAAEASQAAWREILGAALAEIQPAVPATFTGGAYVQQRFTVENLAEAVTGLFRFRLPEGAQLAEADPTLAAEADGAWLWRFELPAGETRRLDLGLWLPPTDGVYCFTAQLEVEQNGVTRPYGDYSFELTVATAEADLAGLRADLAAYSPARTQDRQRRDRALTDLDQAEALAVAGDWDEAIEKLLDAIDLIAQLPAPEVPGWRQRLGRRLLEYGWRSTQEASP